MAAPKEIQLRTLTRISGGQDLLAIASQGSGKTTTCVLAALNRFRQGLEDAPRVLMLVPDKDRVLEILEQFEKLNRNKTIQIVGLYAAPAMEAQLNALADGADIVVATPDRARAIYLKLALNLNKIQLLIIDDADLIVKQGLQLPVAELANSITKAQHLVFTEVMHDKLDKMIKPFMQEPAIIEVDVDSEPKISTYEQVLYQVPNFRTKLNLLNLFLNDAELFSKVVVIVNSPVTTDKIYQVLKRQVRTETMFVRHQSAEAVTAQNIQEFLTTGYRILIALSGSIDPIDLANVSFVIHFDVPEEKETYIRRIQNPDPAAVQDKLHLLFATDLELNAVRRIELETGVRIPLGDLPEELKIETDEISKPKKVAKASDGEPAGSAFHEKKPSNAKTHNYSSGEKARMNKKKKYG
ncbi:MAG: deaD 1 [Sphingobacteriaceae bacterium]|nr:deaD 1 [Sphingobacteriaceae bacterium]